MKNLKQLLVITTLVLLTYAFSFAQQQPTKAPTAKGQQLTAISRLQNLFDSLTPAQRNSFFTNIKHIMEPEVTVIQPGIINSDPPSDAIVLFDGTDINKEWEEVVRGTASGTGSVKPATWVIKDGGLQPVQSSGTLKTKRIFKDFQLHIEWKTPTGLTVTGQSRGNSGVIIQGLYEVQILDSYNNRTYRNGQAGAVYMQYTPLVNASRKPGEWQTYDIIYTAPRFSDSTSYFTPPRITVIHNGVLVQNNVSIQGPTAYHGIPGYIIRQHGPAGIYLQQHGNPVVFRNIWIREL